MCPKAPQKPSLGQSKDLKIDLRTILLGVSYPHQFTEIQNSENPYSNMYDMKSLKVYIHNLNDKDVNTNVRISLLNSQGNECETVTPVKIIKPNNYVELCCYDWVDLRKRGSYRDNGDITIVSVLTVVYSTISSVGPKDLDNSITETTKIPEISLLDKSQQIFSESLG